MLNITFTFSFSRVRIITGHQTHFLKYISIYWYYYRLFGRDCESLGGDTKNNEEVNMRNFCACFVSKEEKKWIQTRKK